MTSTYDVYLIHASEDTKLARELTQALESQGLTVWFNSFIVGPSLKDQMETGLRNSDFGVVLVTPCFFEKQWARNELDAIFQFESSSSVRVLAVWSGVTKEDVETQMPLLAPRFAAILHDDNVDQVAQQLLRSVVELAGLQSLGKRLRMQIATGFSWDRPPRFMTKSIALYDTNFAKEFALTEICRHPETLTRPLGDPVPLMEVLRSHDLWDGRRITVIGKQIRSSVQVFEELDPDHQLPPEPTMPPGGGKAAYVFQLKSVEFTNGELCYVHCIGPHVRGIPGMGPYPPEASWLVLVTGYLMAFGMMHDARGTAVNSMYIACSSILMTPPVESHQGV